jgi:L-lysine 2,3-aminomutase
MLKSKKKQMAVTSLAELSKILQIKQKNVFLTDFTEYPLKVPQSFVARMQKGNINDPLLLQILPTKYELQTNAGYKKDPLAEKKYCKIPGLLHKYFGRVLILLTDNCPINCRFCFRKFWREKALDFHAIYNYIARDKTIFEVIFSGGEPLTLSDKKLGELINLFTKIPQVKQIRIHTRMPILMPQRITPGLLRVLKNAKKQIIMVLHCNHPNEINAEVNLALGKLRIKNVVLLSQTVLLKNINDQANILIDLCKKLFAIGVLPYYLHVLDKVSGTKHFAVEKKKAKKIHIEMLTKLPGYMVPKMVKDVEGSRFKVRQEV